MRPATALGRRNTPAPPVHDATWRTGRPVAPAAAVASHPFRVAKTAVRNPHDYTLRHEWQDVGNEVYNEVIRMIREHGYTEWFGGYPWRMLNANGYKYWTYYSSYVEEVIVLNRKPLSGADAEQAEHRSR